MKKTLLLSLFLSCIIVVLLSDANSTNANSGSPPIGRAGAPMDNAGLTCASCHSGSSVTQTTGVISTDIPSSGYIAGTTYNFTVTMSGAGAYGFEMTPQTATSNVGLGTWIAGVGTNISTKYIRQSAKKTGTNAVWTFKWVAPSTATLVTFYGAFNYANNNGNTAGDIIKTSSVTVLANTTGVTENIKDIVVSIFPNPTNEQLHISSLELLKEGEILNSEGTLIKVISGYELTTKIISVTELPKGLYFLKITPANSKTVSSKFIKN